MCASEVQGRNSRGEIGTQRRQSVGAPGVQGRTPMQKVQGRNSRGEIGPQRLEYYMCIPDVLSGPFLKGYVATSDTKKGVRVNRFIHGLFLASILNDN